MTAFTLHPTFGFLEVLLSFTYQDSPFRKKEVEGI
jgi:hypothetical protein